MSGAALIPLDTALDRLFGLASSPEKTEHSSINAALGRILAADQHAIRDVPPTDNSAMDGYALRASDAGRELSVSQRVAAGDDPSALAAGTAARIFTGAPIPAGADAVVMQEDVRVAENRVLMPEQMSPGQHIRSRGQDCAHGELLLSAGRRLLPQDLGLLASQGFAQIPVFPRLRVALLSTGSELREVDEGELPPGAIYNSNRPMLAGLLTALGCEVLDLGIVADTPEATREALLAGAAGADLVLSSGGVSVGEADYVRDTVNSLGAIDLWRIAIKPGKPFAHGRIGNTPFIGLPGNPSSAFVTFVLLARPYICALQGRADCLPDTLPGRADFEVRNPGSRQEFLRVSIEVKDGEIWARPFANQSSGVLRSVSESDALAVVPKGFTVAPGDRVELLLLDRLLG